MKLTSFGMQSAGTVWQRVVFRHSERGFEIGISRQGPGLQRNYGTGHAKVATTPIHDPAKQRLFHLQISHFSPCTTQPFHLRLATLFSVQMVVFLAAPHVEEKLRYRILHSFGPILHTFSSTNGRTVEMGPIC